MECSQIVTLTTIEKQLDNLIRKNNAAGAVQKRRTVSEIVEPRLTNLETMIRKLSTIDRSWKKTCRRKLRRWQHRR